MVAALIVLLPVVILAGAWRLGGVSAIEDDLIYFLPIRQYIGERVRAGELPLWNPLVAMGSPIAADPQAGLWYPPTYLFAALKPLWAYPLTLVLHFALAGAGMYRFLRSCRHDWRAALLGAVAFEFSGFLIAHRAHLTILEAAAWLPWMFYAWRRFADRGAYRYFALAVVTLGMQMLVQQVQVSIIGLALLTGYVAFVLWPQRRGLAWQYPGGIALGVMLSGIQLIPTLFYFAGSIRGAPAFHLFVENSWWPGSALMMLLPMLFGVRTPNLWDQSWWGMSHFCEQSAYASILLLAMSSVALLRHPSPEAAGRRREGVFWWFAVLAALVVALGKYAPAGRWLFEVPIYSSLRVPARWILVWSFVLPVLASMVVDTVQAGGRQGQRVARAVRRTALVALPLIAGFCLLLMVLVRGRVDELAGRFPSAANVWAGLRAAIRPDNPALWFPLAVLAVTAVLTVLWTRRPTAGRFAPMFIACVLDLAAVAAFVDVDTRTYRRSDLESDPPLARAIRELNPRPGDRLLVPRFSASYERPIEVLWPQTNVQYGIATFNGYGPLCPAAHRWLFHFMPWGSSEAILSLLTEPDLCRAMGIRFVAVRSPEERVLLASAQLPRLPQPQLSPIACTEDGLRPVRTGSDLLWPIRIDQGGLYVLTFEAQAARSSADRAFVRLETQVGEGISPTCSIEPADLTTGRRRLRFIFRCEATPGPAQVRVKSERECALWAGLAEFGCLAVLPKQPAPASRPATASAPGSASSGGPFVHRADLPGGISLYELAGRRELVGWAKQVVPVADAAAAVELLQNRPAEAGLLGGAVVEWLDRTDKPPAAGAGPLGVTRISGHQVHIQANSPGEGLLVFNESYDPGWRAFVEGRQVPVFRVNAVVQGVVVPAGPHEVRLVYYPAGLRVGCIWTAGAALVIFLGGWATSRPRGT